MVHKKHNDKNRTRHKDQQGTPKDMKRQKDRRIHEQRNSTLKS